MNQIGLSTLIDDRSNQHELFFKQDITIKRPGSGGSLGKGPARITGTMMSGQIAMEKRKEVTEIYKKIDETFLAKEKKPHEVIDRKT